MSYKFPVDVCTNCGEKLEVDEDTTIMEEEGKPTLGLCPKCFVNYEMVEE